MPALNFQARFADLVLSGEKPHTIRAPRKTPIKRNDALYLFTGMRSPACRRLRTEVALAVTPITIRPTIGRVVLGSGSLNYPAPVAIKLPRRLTEEEIGRLARADGFATDLAFFDWFEETHGEEFQGSLIEWAKIPEAPCRACGGEGFTYSYNTSHECDCVRRRARA